jgi:CRISPR-associated endoribonuclease Cas6
MRFGFNFTTKNSILPLEYRTACISFIKNALTNYQNGEYYEEIYAISIKKDFTFAVNLKHATFTGEQILLPEKAFTLYISSGNARTALILYNSIVTQRGKLYPLAFQNSIELTDVFIEKESLINKSTLKGQLMMPLCVRSHEKKQNRDYYYAFDKEGFLEAFHTVIKQQILDSPNLELSMLDNFVFQPLRMKKTVIKHYGQFIEASLGTFSLQGDTRLLTHLYNDGIGSRRSMGFGYFNIIELGGDDFGASSQPLTE